MLRQQNMKNMSTEMYLQEIEPRFNHRQENAFKQLLKIYFSAVSP